MPALTSTPSIPFYGHTVVRAAFVLALFGWGVGFYGPPVFVHAVVVRTGWSLPLVSAAVTFHFLFGAGVVAFLPRIHQRWGVPTATVAGAVLLAVGVLGWAVAVEPWQLFIAAMLTGGGWVPLGAAGINAMVSPWFAQTRPMALAKAYNGASVGGMVFSPLWAVLIDRFGFVSAALGVGLGMVAVVGVIANRTLARTPASAGQCADGRAFAPPIAAMAGNSGSMLSGLWCDRRFVTLSAAMSLGLFAQIGLITQLFSLLVPSLGASVAGAMMALATGCGMGGRLVMASLLAGRAANRRHAAAASYAVQAVGTLVLWAAGADGVALWVAGMVLFGLGIGNATSLPPLIAQAEFVPGDVPRVVARSVAMAQALYAFAPAVLAGLIVRDASGLPPLGSTTGVYFFVVFVLQVLAAGCVLIGGGAAQPSGGTQTEKF